MGSENSGLRELPYWQSCLALEYMKNESEDFFHREKIVKVYKRNLDKNFQLDGDFLVRFPIVVKNRKALIESLNYEGVYISDIWYDAPISPKKKLSETDYNGQCVNSENISEKILNLPTHKNIKVEDALVISSIINKWPKD